MEENRLQAVRTKANEKKKKQHGAKSKKIQIDPILKETLFGMVDVVFVFCRYFTVFETVKTFLTALTSILYPVDTIEERTDEENEETCPEIDESI